MTAEQLEALSDLVEIALNDQRDYLSYGNPHIDYDDEWPEVAREKAKRFRITAAFFRGHINGFAESLESLAGQLEDSANEYRNVEVGN